MNTSRIMQLSLIFVFLITTSFTCKEEQRIDQIIIHYVDMQVETPFQISCNNFESSFSDSYKTVVIKDSVKLKRFAEYLVHCDVSDSAKGNDVRVKVIVFYSNKRRSLLCMDRFYNLVLDNKSINTSQNIINFIKKQIGS